ncbi:VCBS repeat-containing protein [Akkermansiaceae bacterium]|nr:VCBS repeat-containing protein [Akkermansiaceae bacterium]MDB4537736.1 VCBS repeat-containing protein [Akkermansiaceae bacterium]
MTRTIAALILISSGLAFAQEKKTSDNPALKQRRYDSDLSDSYNRIDPSKDGWDSEARGDAYGAQLKDFVHYLLDDDDETAVPSPNFKGNLIRPTSLDTIFSQAGLSVQRGRSSGETHTLKAILPKYPAKKLKSKIKVTKIEASACEALVTFKGSGFQVNSSWLCEWTESNPPLLRSLAVLDYEEIIQEGEPLLSDITRSALGSTKAYQEQLIFPVDYWRHRFPRDFGLDAAANHGLAIGDVNGDGLEDLYLCFEGGLPNKLFVQNPDGTLRDFTEESKTGWMDFCAAALLIDLDNDGDKDLVISQDFKILFMENLDGKGHFELVFGSSTLAQSFSLSAADFDLDGFLDVYICGYNPSFSASRAGALGEPVPFHDANNGGNNMLWRNLGNWTFEDVAPEVGLDENNTRFSFAASWEDYDQDGDLDLYVANDFGRNCLYQNQGIGDNKLPRFKNIAPQLDVEDSSAGMSASWGDFNRDGWMDLYISNMFSSAGNRITYQKQFQGSADEKTRATFQRMARGNTLFSSDGKGGFTDISVESGTTMARWSWGSTFVDLNNDGWLDILAANGFITAEDTGDL